jgi:hypothetical protein
MIASIVHLPTVTVIAEWDSLLVLGSLLHDSINRASPNSYSNSLCSSVPIYIIGWQMYSGRNAAGVYQSIWSRRLGESPPFRTPWYFVTCEFLHKY